MNVSVRTTASFRAAAKPLLKKYRSLSADLSRLEKELLKDPKMGTPLGRDAYKIRLKVTSKGKGKSGGARVISLVETTLIGVATITSGKEIVVNLITIYDKSDIDSVSDKELNDLIKLYKDE